MAMFLEAPTLDDLLASTLSDLKSRPFDVISTRSDSGGPSSEIIGASLKLTNPRARLSRTETKGTVFSAVGELLWYLKGTNSLDFIRYYIKKYESESDDGITIHGGYGPRLFNNLGKYDQIKNVISLLKSKQSSRRAAMQLFEAGDLVGLHKDIPCTCTIQFLCRNNRLDMIVYMRSNDAFYGLPHDIFSFTMLQEIISRSIGVELGEYYHFAGSLHLYENKVEEVEQYLNEGWQPTTQAMPSMPFGDPWDSIQIILKLEEEIRNDSFDRNVLLSLPGYWRDIVYILELYKLYKEKVNDKTAISEILNKMESATYKTYIIKKFKL